MQSGYSKDSEMEQTAMPVLKKYDQFHKLNQESILKAANFHR